jgi:hypothetical protein
MTVIKLHRPIPGMPTGRYERFERVHMFPGRHLGQEEFQKGQSYADLRLMSLLRGRAPGIVHGLDLNLGPQGVGPASIGFVVNPGLALDAAGRVVSLYNPLRAEWEALITEWLIAHDATDATGVYYLLLKRSNAEIDSPSVPPCQRMELDPTRDVRRVVTSTLVLQRLNIAAGAVTTTPRERIENLVAADRVDGAFLTEMGNAVPLALLAVAADGGGRFRPLWLSMESGRYEAVPASGYRVLLNQTSAALRRAMQQAAGTVSLAQLPTWLTANLHLDFLPAAGQLPLEWLQAPDSTHPSMMWLPKHLGIDMVPVPEEAVLELLNRHIARRVIDLRRPAGDKIRLLLAVNEPDYRHDLLDIPPTDARLEADLYRYYIRAYDAWRRWREQFDRLYYFDDTELSLLPEDKLALRAILPDPVRQLGLPKPVIAPVLPANYFSAMFARMDQELDPDNPGYPYPFNKAIPRPAFFDKWLDEGQPPPFAHADEDGCVVRYAVALSEMDALENQIRATRMRVEKTRDLLLLMRQQLDSQTVALAALAGGVAGDGSGLQVARWLPFTNLSPTENAEVTEAPASIATKTAGSTVAVPARTASAGATPGGIGNTLLDSALGKNTASAAGRTQLANNPKSFSAFELGINKSRLDLLSRISRETVNRPAFEAKEYRFSVIDHINPEVNEYAKAYYGMKDLLATLKDLFDPTDAASLRGALQRVGRADEEGEGPGEIGPFQRSNRLESPAVLDNLAKRDATIRPETATDTGTGTDAKSTPISLDTKKFALLSAQYRYHALFKAGRILTQWIAITESRYHTIERKLRARLSEQAAKAAQIDKLAGEVRVARETLENLDRIRIEQLGDYGVAQRLLEEDWRKVYAVNKERTRILTTGLRGLYYVRVRSTPVSATLSDTLVLRHGSSSDPVPGVDWDEEVDLPEALHPFFGALCEIPMNDWVRLRPLQPKIPPSQQFEFLNQVRQSRFKGRPGTTATGANTGTLQARLQTLHAQNNLIMQQWSASALPLASESSVQTQSAAAQVLSLDDLALVTGTLRTEAQGLKDQLERAAWFTLQQLTSLPGTLRLLWGQLAEDDRLRVEDVSWWPGLQDAERDDFNAIRTVSELIAWWFRQISADASASSRSACRNMIRALLIHASLGDPQEILRGNVHVPPRLTRVGERLQVKLNRNPEPGTRLQLLDPDQHVVALLAVEDHTPSGTQVSIVNLVQPEARINTRFTVVATKRTRDNL